MPTLISHDGVPDSSDPLAEQWIDLRLVSAMRIMLAASALLIVLIDRNEAISNFDLTLICLVTYTIYGLIVFGISIHRSDLIPSHLMHWIDVVWYASLIALSSGSHSVFFNLFFFAILAASFSWGYTSGLLVTLVSAALFAVAGIINRSLGLSVELDQLLLRIIQLLILGFMISRWGGFKVNMIKRLQLLQDVTLFSSPRYGIDRTINNILERLRSFYEAEGCLLLIPSDGEERDSYQLYRVRRGMEAAGTSPPQISSEAAALFLSPSSNFAVLHRRDGRGQTLMFDIHEREFYPGDSTLGDRVSSALETPTYLSVPVHDKSQSGRLYIIGATTRFDSSAISFVVQIMNHVSPLIENTRLVDSLASYAAEEERRRIARDIHDSVIQPYVGLQLGITALSQKLRAGNTDVLQNAEELLTLTNQELIELRRYVWGLRAGEERRDVLLPAVQRFVSRFASVTGINVEVTAPAKIEINDRLAAELFQMVAEGLSNVRRHALCDEAKVNLKLEGSKLLLEIKNRRPDLSGELDSNGNHSHYNEPLFQPHSIAERAALLGGDTVVSIDEKNYTVVTVAIPL